MMEGEDDDEDDDDDDDDDDDELCLADDDDGEDDDEDEVCLADDEESAVELVLSESCAIFLEVGTDVITLQSSVSLRGSGRPRSCAGCENMMRKKRAETSR
jgi:hypothetical protein